MREHITPDDICNEILRSRSVRKGPVLLVEGVTDDRFYGKFTDPGVIIIECHSKDALIKSVKNLRLRGEDKTLGIADADLDLIEGKTPPPQSVYFTDYRDMEMVCIYSGSLDDIINEYGNRDKIRQFTEKYGSVKNALTSAAAPAGLLMYISKKRGLGMRFEDLDFEAFVDGRNLRLDQEAMIKAVLRNSRTVRATASRLNRELSDMIRRTPDLRIAPRGHDAVSVLLLFLKKNGSFNARNLTAGSLGGALRLAFSDEDFRETGIYRNTSEWAESRRLALWNPDIFRNRSR